ncbi:MAG: cupredoxin domain-containing protein [Salinisphaera sp.]|jgi:plastocyanin|nr:cupredoxin domain-containing protein [Salinisphaera sp.]
MKPARRALLATGLFIVALLISTNAAASSQYEISVVSNAFEPAQLTIPAGKRVEVMVHNKTAMPAEFESYDFTAEKVVPGGTSIPVYIGPLKPGTYEFFNDFARGVKGHLSVK